MDALRKECAEWEQERNIRFLTIGTCFFARTICNSQNPLIPHSIQTHIITLQTLAEHTLPVLLGLAGRSRVVVTVQIVEISRGRFGRPVRVLLPASGSLSEGRFPEAVS